MSRFLQPLLRGSSFPSAIVLEYRVSIAINDEFVDVPLNTGTAMCGNLPSKKETSGVRDFDQLYHKADGE